jgi:hypothetical protein
MVTMTIESNIDRALAACDAELAAAAVALNPADRFIYAHLAAVRAASAYLRLLRVPKPRGAAASIWERLATAAPDFALWATFLSSGTRRRRALEGGAHIYDEEADEMVEVVEHFRDAVAKALSPGVLERGYAAGFPRGHRATEPGFLSNTAPARLIDGYASAA